MSDEIIISWEDLKQLYQRKKRKIFWGAFIGGLLFMGNALIKPPSYPAIATFKQSSSRIEAGFDYKKIAKTMLGGPSEGSTTPLMLSRAVLTKTIEELGLQAEVQEERALRKTLSTMQSNLLTELHRQLQDQKSFRFQNVHFEGEKPRMFFLKITSEENFELLDSKRQKIAAGQCQKPFQYEDVAFTLVQTSKNTGIYPLKILPCRNVIESVKKKITVKPLREDKNILAINFFDTDRQRSADFVNTLMKKYEAFLIEENKEVLTEQIKYLDHRQDELSAKLDVDMQDHVAILKKSLLERGFMGIEEEMEGILLPLQNYQARLSEIEVEMAGLEKQLSQTDAVKAESSVDLVHQFGQNSSEQIEQAILLLKKLENDEPLPTHTVLGETFISLFRGVEQSLQAWKNGNDDQKSLYLERKQQLTAHLKTYIDHLSSRQKNIEESMTYIEKLTSDFTGMSLEASRELFQQYCRQLDDLHAQMKQVIFFRDHLHEPNFEISTLSNVLSDGVSQQLVQKASELEGQLCDLINRSGREHERLKETIAIQKRFLESHLTQTLDLGKIRIQLIKEKIGSLYEVMNHLLQQEKTIIENQILALKNDMVELPDLWLKDKQLKFKAGLTKGMMEGLTQIAETKNLSRHLYQVESKPLDIALPPYAPKPPHLILKGLAGAVSAALLLYFFSLVHGLIRGLPASLMTLRLMGGHISGSFKAPEIPFDQLSDQDLESLRKVAAFLMERKERKSSVACLSEQGSEFCFNLAHLLALHQQKILILDCNFDKTVSLENQPGLYQYLNNLLDGLPIRHDKYYDSITAGDTTRHGLELLSSASFRNLLSTCLQRYDFVFLVRKASLNSQEAEQILHLADLAVITTCEESQEILKPYLAWSRQKEKLCGTFAQYFLGT